MEKRPSLPVMANFTTEESLALNNDTVDFSSPLPVSSFITPDTFCAVAAEIKKHAVTTVEINFLIYRVLFFDKAYKDNSVS
jgi:hypothetical protein